VEKRGRRIERKHKNRDVEEVLCGWWGGVYLRGIGGREAAKYNRKVEEVKEV
jgi:hypothetical protein